MQERIVVTGAGGFIGRNVVSELNARGQVNLLLVDRFGSDDKWKNLLGLQFEDVVDPDAFLKILSADQPHEITTIIHLGACSATTERNVDFLLDNNYRYTKTLAEYAVANDVRLVYASSAATYGDGSLGYSDADEIMPKLRPLNAYGYSKQLLDLWALQHGLLDRIVGLKYFNVFGPFESHKEDMRSVVHKSFHQIEKEGRVALFKSERPDYGDGQQKRDFIYVKDAVDVTLHFADRSTPGGLYNCGTGQARTWKDLATAVFAAMGREPQIDYIDLPAALAGKYQYFTQADVTKLRSAGYERPFTSLESAVDDYVKNYLCYETAGA